VIALDTTAIHLYADHLVALGSSLRAPGLRVVVDCANGAASVVAPEVLRRLGHDVTVLFAEPDGTNINDRCGSTYPSALSAEVVARGADLGLAFDGDADRCIAVDDRGSVIDGDDLIALFALDLAAAGALAGGGVVVTVMSNLGLRRTLEARGLTVVETAIGDRAVVEALESEGFVLGGEQSGHIVFRDRATTGDGTLTGLLLCALVGRSGRPLSALTDGLITRVRQQLVTVPVEDRARVANSVELATAVEEAATRLGSAGRLLVRASGTEHAIRIMVETDDEALAADLIASLIGAVRAAGAATSG
jgi:phosphoglucosamine mutase